ncbi:MAG: autotransporter domain-containing protein [Lacibacter sp.]|nr:autotransporter domain-containing protein [Lacibacter sp.]
MKTFYLTTVLLTLGIASNAQIQKGTIHINGQFASNSGANNQTIADGLIKSFSIRLNPNVGYFVMDRWEIGSGLLFSTTKNRYKNVIPGSSEKYTSNSFGLQAYTKYYFGNGALKPYVTANGSHTWLTNKTTYVNTGTFTSKINSWNAGAGVGLAWFASQRVGLFSQLTFDNAWNNNNNSNQSLNLNFGVQVNLGKKK